MNQNGDTIISNYALRNGYRKSWTVVFIAMMIGFFTGYLPSHSQAQEPSKTLTLSPEAQKASDLFDQRIAEDKMIQTRWKTLNEWICYSSLDDFARFQQHATSKPLDWNPIEEMTVKETSFIKSDKLNCSFKISFSESFKNRLNLPADFAEYTLQIDPYTQSIWSPEIWQPLLQGMNLPIKSDSKELEQSFEDFLKPVRSLDYLALETSNQQISALIANDLTNPRLHVRAAILLELVAFQEGITEMSNRTHAMNRMAMHLALADYFGSEETEERVFAETFKFVLEERQVDALNHLGKLDSGKPYLQQWINVFTLNANGGDYRIAENWVDPTPLEKLEYFRAFKSKNYSTDVDHFLRTHDFYIDNNTSLRILWIRSLQEEDFTVGVGHIIADSSISEEAKVFASLCKLAKDKDPFENINTSFLHYNELPQPFIGKDASNGISIRVISSGLWADQFQRFLMQAIISVYQFFKNDFGDIKQALAFRDSALSNFKSFRYFPLIRREIMKKHDEVWSFEYLYNWYLFVGDFPHFIPPYYTPQGTPLKFDEYKRATKFSTLTNFFMGTTPAGTSFLSSYYFNILASDRPDLDSVFGSYFKILSPNNSYGDYILFRTNLKEYDITAFSNTFERFSAYDARLYWKLVTYTKNHPNLKAYAQEKFNNLHHSSFLNFVTTEFRNNINFDPTEHLEKLKNGTFENVSLSSICRYAVTHYMYKGEIENARYWADFGYMVYSGNGIEAQIIFCNLTNDHEKVYNLLQQYSERYDKPSEYEDYFLTNVDKDFARRNNILKECEDARLKLFPNGVVMDDPSITTAPKNGVIIESSFGEAYPIAPGIALGDIIVAVEGYTIKNISQLHATRFWIGKIKYSVRLYRPSDQHYYTVIINNQLGKFYANLEDYEN